MSVVVNGLSLPKDCPLCPMSHWKDNFTFTGCNAVLGKRIVADSDLKFWQSNHRPEWCPLVEIQDEEMGK